MNMHPEYLKLKREAIQGWQTWNVRSVLSHVHMPDGFALNLAVKEPRNGHYLKEALIGRFGEYDERVFPGPHAYDGSYTEVTVEWMQLRFRVESTFDGGDLILLVTNLGSYIKHPQLMIEAGFLWNRAGTIAVDERGLHAQSPERSYHVRSTAVLTFADKNMPTQTPYIAVLMQPETAFYTGSERSIEEIKRLLDQKRAQLMAGWAQYGELRGLYEAMQSAVAWDTIYDANNDRIISPVSRLWSIGSGGYVLFCWDTYFAACMAALGDRAISYSNVIEITLARTGAGFVPNFLFGTGMKSEDRSQPPVGSAMLREVYRIHREKWIVEYLYPMLFEWNTWFFEHRMAGTGALCWGSDPIVPQFGNGWEENGINDTFGGALESGLDNSPMYDDVPFDKDKHVMKLEDVGLTGLYILDCKSLIELAKLIGADADVPALEARMARAEAGLQGLWDEDKGFFFNRRTDTGAFSRRISPTNFYALFSGKVTKDQARRIMDGHYFNPDEFYGDWMLPSIARNDAAYKDQNYWRGRVWAPMNFLVYMALMGHDADDVRHDLAQKSAALMLNEWNAHRHIHENYNADTGSGCDVENSDKFYHWGALLALVALIEGGHVKDFGGAL